MQRAVLVLALCAGTLTATPADHDDARAAFVASGAAGLIAYTAPARGPLNVNQELFVVDARGGKPLRLTANGAYDGTPRFSPSGDRVALTRTVSYGRPARSASGIVVVDLRRQERTLVRYTQLGGRAQWPRWSPDGRWIGFQRLRGAGRPHPIELWVVRPDGSGLRRLPVAGAFNNLDINPDAGEQAWDWSPDGRHVVFQHRDPLTDYGDDYGGDIAVAEIATGKQRIIGVGRHPDWSPRRDEIALAHDNLYVARADGRGSRRIGLPFVPTTPSWSPDGDRIAFVGELDLGGGAAVYVVNRDGSGLRRLARADAVKPHWSPDGAWIAFTERDSVMRVSAQGGRPVRVARPGIHVGWGIDWR